MATARWPAVLGATVVFLAVGGVAAIAAIPGGDGVITGCYSTKAGALRVVDETARCKDGETRIGWNQQGPAGPQGAPGEQGPIGEPGQQGPAGVTNVANTYTRGAVHSWRPPSGATSAAIAYCLPGDQVISGGYQIGYDPDARAQVLDNFPEMVPSPSQGWHVTLQNVGPEGTTFSATTYVLCMDIGEPADPSVFP